jgi:GT2 family glycosyltransferase/glycosyltransferase involved in cell wall biosynthesis
MTSAETHAPCASICIPTYNGDRYLEAAIVSATSQTFSNVEILIVDDGSHDRTLDIADQFALGDPRVRVVRNAKALGLPGNWDRCIDLAQGEWVKFLFQDDVLSPRCVERLHAAVRPGVDIVVCRRAAVAEPGVADGFAQEYATYVATHDLSRRFPRTTFVTPAQFAAHVVDHPTANCIGEPTATLIRRSAFDRFGRFHPGLCQLVDWEHAARIAVQTGLCYVDEALVTIRLHPSMATVRQSRGSRFRTDLLDPLLVLHEIAFSPWFEPVRRAGRARPDPVVFDAVLRREVDRARVVASDQTRGIDSVPADSQQLSDLLRRYPRLAPSPARDSGSALAIATAALHGFLASDARLRFARVGDPTVSAIVVARNRAELTCRALRSLLADDSIPLEVVVVDNASTDETTDVLARCDGVTVARNDANIGFGPAVNQACALAKGEYLLLLNSDAEVLPGSISSALRTIAATGVGAVGGRLILEDGRLQEAGSIVWRDGSSSGYGRGDMPFAPMYSFERDVDYCSAALLLTRRDCFVDLGGFDPAYAPAYYEDVDYCFRLRGAGWRVVYDPTFIARHTEFGSSGSPDEALARQSRNRGTFVEKHRRALAAQHSPQEASPLEGRMVPPRGLRILYIDDQVPRDALGAGLPRARQVLRTLVGLGHFVTMYPLVYCEESSPGLREIPRTIEVMKGYGPERLWEILRERSGYYDRVIVSRPHNFQTFRSVIGENTEQIAIGTVIYDAEAIFTQRETDLERLRGETVTAGQERLDAEVQLARAADVVISVSDQDRETFEAAGCPTVVTVGHCIEPAPTPATFADRAGFLFVGPTHDERSPNTDGIVWFVTEILPLLDGALQADVRLTVVGQTGSARVAALAGPKVATTGPLADLSGAYDAARVFVAPIRAAAGISHKLHHAAAHGVPIVCTQLVASQLGWHDERELLVATDSESFARQCARLYRDPALWHRLRENALEGVRIDCSPETFTRGVVRALAENRSSRRYPAGPGGRSSVSVQVSPAPVVHTSVAGPFSGSGSEEALRSARREIAELRQSMSWRITAPLRFVYGLFLKAGRPRSK